MATLKTMIAALLAGSLAATAGGVAYAKADGQAFDPAQVPAAHRASASTRR